MFVFVDHPCPVKTSGNTAVVNFVSDGSGEAEGFILKYRTIHGGNISHSAGECSKARCVTKQNYLRSI